EVGRDHLEAHVAGDDRADLLDERAERTVFLGDQRGVGRHPVDDAERHAFLDLFDTRRIEKNLHRGLPGVNVRAAGRRGAGAPPAEARLWISGLTAARSSRAFPSALS